MYSSVSSKILAQHGKTPDWDFKMKVLFVRVGKKIVCTKTKPIFTYDLNKSKDIYKFFSSNLKTIMQFLHFTHRLSILLKEII